jgi:microcystin-dependent protein
VSRTTYADLFTILSTTYGVGDGSTTFNLPNLKGRIAVGLDSSQTEFDALGETGGAKTHTLTTDEIPGHTHGVVTQVGSLSPVAGSTQMYTGSTDGSQTGSTGGGGAHNNLQPYLVLNYIIKT